LFPRFFVSPPSPASFHHQRRAMIVDTKPAVDPFFPLVLNFTTLLFLLFEIPTDHFLLHSWSHTQNPWIVSSNMFPFFFGANGPPPRWHVLRLFTGRPQLCSRLNLPFKDAFASFFPFTQLPNGLRLFFLHCFRKPRLWFFFFFFVFFRFKEFSCLRLQCTIFLMMIFPWALRICGHPRDSGTTQFCCFFPALFSPLFPPEGGQLFPPQPLA